MGSWASTSAMFPSSFYHSGLGNSGCLNQAKDRLAYSEGLRDTRSWCGPGHPALVQSAGLEPMMGWRRTPPVLGGHWYPWVSCVWGLVTRK